MVSMVLWQYSYYGYVRYGNLPEEPNGIILNSVLKENECVIFKHIYYTHLVLTSIRSLDF